MSERRGKTMNALGRSSSVVFEAGLLRKGAASGSTLSDSPWTVQRTVTGAFPGIKPGKRQLTLQELDDELATLRRQGAESEAIAEYERQRKTLLKQMQAS